MSRKAGGGGRVDGRGGEEARGARARSAKRQRAFALYALSSRTATCVTHQPVSHHFRERSFLWHTALCAGLAEHVLARRTARPTRASKKKKPSKQKEGALVRGAVDTADKVGIDPTTFRSLRAAYAASVVTVRLTAGCCYQLSYSSNINARMCEKLLYLVFSGASAPEGKLFPW